MDPTNSS
jgi:hypothetical protein